MVLFVCILKDYRRVEDVHLGLVELGVTGGTVLEGRGMGQILTSEVPIFAGLRGLFPGAAAESHVIFSVMARSRVSAWRALVERVAGPLDAPGSGVLFTLPVDEYASVMPEIR